MFDYSLRFIQVRPFLVCLTIIYMDDTTLYTVLCPLTRIYKELFRKELSAGDQISLSVEI